MFYTIDRIFSKQINKGILSPLNIFNMSDNFKVGHFVWTIFENKKKCYKIIDVIPDYVKVETGSWLQKDRNNVQWIPKKKEMISEYNLNLAMKNFTKSQQWMCVYCKKINKGSDVKCKGTWYGNLPYPHTKYGSLPNNQQYFLWGGEQNGIVKFPPSVQHFKFKEWKVDSQKKILKSLYSKGVPCNAIRCTHLSHANKTYKGRPQIIVYPYPNGLRYMPGEMVGHVRTGNETICPRCFNHYPQYQMPFNFILYDKHRIRYENERNWWFVEVLFWIKHEILDKNKILTPNRCESLIHKMYSKIISKTELPDYINTVFTKAPGKSDYTWYSNTSYELSFKKTLEHFVNYLFQTSKEKGGKLNLQTIIKNKNIQKLKF